MLIPSFIQMRVFSLVSMKFKFKQDIFQSTNILERHRFINIICQTMILITDLTERKNHRINCKYRDANIFHKNEITNHNFLSKMNSIQREKHSNARILLKIQQKNVAHSNSQTHFNKKDQIKSQSQQVLMQSTQWSQRKNKIEFLSGGSNNFLNTTIKPIKKIVTETNNLRIILKQPAKQTYYRRFRSISQNKNVESSLEKYKNLSKQFDKEKMAILSQRRVRKKRSASLNTKLSKMQGLRISPLNRVFRLQQNQEAILVADTSKHSALPKFKSARYSDIPISQFIYEDEERSPDLGSPNGFPEKMENIYKNSKGINQKVKLSSLNNAKYLIKHKIRILN